MGFFGPFVYESKKNKKKYWLHMKEQGNSTLYYFSPKPMDSINSIPKGYEVIENPRTGLPLLKKKGEKKEKKK